MSTCFAPVSISGGGGSHLKARELWLKNCNFLGIAPKLTIQRKSNLRVRKRSSPIIAEYRDGGRGGVDFVAGFLLGGVVFGTLAYIYAPQIRRSLLIENEHGFRRATRPIYYYEDDGLERTRQTLNEKISQLNSVIDSVSSRLRGGSNAPAAKGRK